MSLTQPNTLVRACLVTLMAHMAVCMRAAAQTPLSDVKDTPHLMDREKETNLALSARPPPAAKAAAGDAPTRHGHEQAPRNPNSLPATDPHPRPTGTTH